MQAIIEEMPDTTRVVYYKLTAICVPISYLTVFGDLWNNQVWQWLEQCCNQCLEFARMFATDIANVNDYSKP